MAIQQQNLISATAPAQATVISFLAAPQGDDPCAREKRLNFAERTAGRRHNHNEYLAEN